MADNSEGNIAKRYFVDFRNGNSCIVDRKGRYYTILYKEQGNGFQKCTDVLAIVNDAEMAERMCSLLNDESLAFKRALE